MICELFDTSLCLQISLAYLLWKMVSFMQTESEMWKCMSLVRETICTFLSPYHLKVMLFLKKKRGKLKNEPPLKSIIDRLF